MSTLKVAAGLLCCLLVSLVMSWILSRPFIQIPMSLLQLALVVMLVGAAVVAAVKVTVRWAKVGLRARQERKMK